MAHRGRRLALPLSENEALRFFLGNRFISREALAIYFSTLKMSRRSVNGAPREVHALGGENAAVNGKAAVRGTQQGGALLSIPRRKSSPISDVIRRRTTRR
jgi:hypothetical protein